MAGHTAHDAGVALATRRSVVGIVGAGHIGCFIGAYLCHDPTLDVRFFAREQQALELSAYGLAVSDANGLQHVIRPVACYADLSTLIECDVVLLTVKATALVSLLSQLKRFLRPRVPVIALQNGIGVAEMLNHDLPNPVYRAIVPFNVIRKKPGHYHRTTSGTLYWQSSQDRLVQHLAQQLVTAGLSITLAEDMQPIEYGKLLLNLNNALNAVSDIPLQQQLLQRKYRLILAAAMREWLAICKAERIKPKAFTAVPNTLLPGLLSLPTPLFRHLAKKMLDISPEARSSMWDDIQQHKTTEIIFLNGAVVRLGLRHNIATPANALLVELVKRKEQGESIRADASSILQRLRH